MGLGEGTRYEGPRDGAWELVGTMVGSTVGMGDRVGIGVGVCPRIRIGMNRIRKKYEHISWNGGGFEQ